ncbi:inactive glucose-1-phosphate adenylyltransferase small subunit 2, chloroplastic [Amaranthus tricolor]|uniref:inactive glucose-1-phosphate adenylyltransferase small subunit 2, chloroplastic n=1 Tax=Amaranthus tricolor TaxID=29722 RepID=UPI00258A46E6|nr:inactive glucose-1-phosphate adenylyltransferase small subunit 2, chloroplastic [Amaranthus tricolor]
MVTLHLNSTSWSMNIKHQVTRLQPNEVRIPNKIDWSCLASTKFEQPDERLRLSLSTFENQRDCGSESVAAILFGNGSDCDLSLLTRRRSAGAVPLGAKYRLIDGVVSNCIHSNITKMYALTQFNSTSLNSHLTRAYSNFGLGKDHFLQVIAACQTPQNQTWFQGNADAIRRFLWMLEDSPVTDFLILPGYHLYRMNYQEILHFHQQTTADITISALISEQTNDKGFGILTVNSDNQVLNGSKSGQSDLLQVGSRLVENCKDNKCTTYASMGIYVIKKEALVKILKEDFPWANDFSSEVIPGAISIGMKVKAHLFDGYWENMQSIKGFYEANMESTKTTDIRYDFCHRDFPLYTLARRLPPTRVLDSLISDSSIGDGCILNNCRIKGSVIGHGTRIEDAVVIEDSILMGSDIYQEDLVPLMKKKKSTIRIGIGQGSFVRKAIIDKNARIGRRVMIINKDNIQEGNRKDQEFVIRDGIVIITKSAIIPDDTIL